MNYFILALLFFLSGFLMKYSDDLYDVNQDKRLACIFGFFCAIVSAFATIFNVEAAYIFLAILIGNLIAFKIDGIHHVFTLIIFFLVCLIFGIPELNIFILVICIFSAFLDEIGHELISNLTNNLFLNLFFEYRFFMKIIIFLLAIFGVFNLWIFVSFLLFEIAYEFSGFVFKRLN